MIKTKYLAYVVALFTAVNANATTVTFTAQQGTAVSNLAGVQLSGTTVQLGYYNSATFTFLGDTTTAGGTLPAGLFGGSVLFESTSLADFQPAFQIFSDDGGAVIAYSTTWAFEGGDGTGTDTDTNSFDLANVVTAGALATNGVVLPIAGSTFELNGAGNDTFTGNASLAVGLAAVPEPSTYAVLSGLLALGYVAVRRRR